MSEYIFTNNGLIFEAEHKHIISVPRTIMYDRKINRALDFSTFSLLDECSWYYTCVKQTILWLINDRTVNAHFLQSAYKNMLC